MNMFLSVCRAGCLAAAWLCLAASGQAMAQGLYRCPGNVFTNQMHPAQAQHKGCVPVRPVGLTQAQVHARVPHAPTVPAVGVESARPGARTERPLATAVPAPQPVAKARPADPSTPRVPAVDPAVQRDRDRDARQILQNELVRTQGRIQSLMASGGADASRDEALQRLRADEQALQRELARWPG